MNKNVRPELSKKLKKGVPEYIIDTTCGPTLAFIAMVEPDRAKKLARILKTAMCDMYEKRFSEWKKDPESFTHAAVRLCHDLTNSFLLKNITMRVLEGMPDKPVISPINMMGGPFSPPGFNPKIIE